MNAVPTIDISALMSCDLPTRTAVAEQIGQACREIGFFQITGHGVDPELVEAMYTASRRFFDLPAEAKRAVTQPDPRVVRGYSAVGDQTFAYAENRDSPPDLHESFDIGPVDVPRDDPYYTEGLGAVHFLPNQWPEGLPELPGIWTRYFHAMNDLSRRIMRAFALALQLPETYFDDKIDKDISMLRAINYPHSDVPPLPGQMRGGAHTDLGSLTIVRQEVAPGGLEVFTTAGDWVPVPVVPGAFLVNIGDLMAQWTNDTWISTVHRVVNPPAGSGDTRRMSMVFFHQPNYDALVECLPSCLAPGEQPKHEPITSGDHLIKKYRKSRAGLQAPDAPESLSV